jgi:hypothetical protein
MCSFTCNQTKRSFERDVLNIEQIFYIVNNFFVAEGFFKVGRKRLRTADHARLDGTNRAAYNLPVFRMVFMPAYQPSPRGSSFLQPPGASLAE